MAYEYIGVERDQLFLLPPSMWDWLPEGHLALFVIDAVALIDTSAFQAARPTEGAGRRAYDPEMMLALLLYAYAIGVRSSRAIERACLSDLAFRVICANLHPDHGTIARFRADHEEAIGGVFVEVLKLCQAAGLASLGRIAIDGTKIGSDAALDRNRSGEWIRAEINKILAEAAATDRAEESAPGLFDALVPEQLRSRASRLARLEAALEVVEAQEQAAAAKQSESMEKANREASEGRRLRGRKPKDPKAALDRAKADVCAAKLRLEAHPGHSHLQRALEQAEARWREASEALDKKGAAEESKPVANLTDPESRIMKTKDGWIQGYNVQAAANEHQVVVAYDVTQDHNDVAQLAPMTEAVEQTAAAAGIVGPIGLVLADAGYWSEENATRDGPARLIATTKDWKQRKAAREMGETTGLPPEGSSPLEAMEHRLRTAEGARAYACRSLAVEPVFGDMKENRGVRRFIRRGLSAARSEAGLVFATHNLLKVFHHQPSAVLGRA